MDDIKYHQSGVLQQGDIQQGFPFQGNYYMSSEYQNGYRQGFKMVSKKVFQIQIILI